MSGYRFELRATSEGRFMAQFRSTDGDILFSSNAFERRSEAEHAVTQLQVFADNAPIMDLTETPPTARNSVDTARRASGLMTAPNSPSSATSVALRAELAKR